MTKKNLYLLGILLTIILGTFLYCGICCGNCSLFGGNSNAVTGSLYIKDVDGSFEYNSESSFNFKESDYEIMTPLSYDVEDGVGKLFAYLGVSPSKIIDITGYYKSDEENNSAFPNLGIARAGALKNFLVSKGISSKQMNINGVLKDDLTNQNGVIVGPVSFRMSTPGWMYKLREKREISDLYDEITTHPITLYFETAQARIELTEEQRQEIANISVYLDKVEGATCVITGHTDNTGGESTNMRLSQNRAEFAKNYLVRNGIPADKIVTKSDGPNSPIADNSTEEGRAKNRRTVITINNN